MNISQTHLYSFVANSYQEKTEMNQRVQQHNNRVSNHGKMSNLRKIVLPARPAGYTLKLKLKGERKDNVSSRLQG
jgi:hypothetical protein